MITTLADEDFMAQVEWAGELEKHRDDAARLFGGGLGDEVEATKTAAVAHEGEAVITRVCDTDLLCRVESGALDVVAGHGQSVRLREGEGVRIPRHRLHGLSGASPRCLYHAYELKDGKA